MCKSFKTTISGQLKKVVIVPVDVPALKQLPTHHIFMIDRSGSMHGSIDSLIDQLTSAFSLLDNQDLVTVSWFSSPGDCAIPIQGSPVTSTALQLVNSLRSVRETTCFSELLERLITSVNDLAPFTQQAVLHLFTDGVPVVPWSQNDERDRIMHALKLLCEKVVSVNTIGYGSHYNRDLLVGMSGISQFGVFTHTSDIEQYFTIVKNACQVSSSLAAIDVTIECDNSDIIYLGNNVATLSTNRVMYNRLCEKSTFFLVCDPKVGSYTLNGQKHKIGKTINHKELQSTIIDFFYAYASRLYYHGQRRKALDILTSNVKDRRLVELLTNSFTFDEVSNSQLVLDKCVFDPDQRLKGGKIQPGYMPAKDAFCLLDLFGLMSGTSSYYLPFSDRVSKYERVTKKVTDSYNMFVASNNEVLAPIHELVWNKDRMNLSVRFKVNGIVRLNPKAAENVNLPSDYVSCIYRNHCFVKDGQLNIKKAEFLIPEAVYSKLNALKVNVFEHVSMESMSGGSEPLYRAVVNLAALPIINFGYVQASDNLHDLLTVTETIAKLEAAQKVAGIILDDIYAAGAKHFLKQGHYTDLTYDQIRVLEEHGVSREGVYGGIGNAEKPASECDSYTAKAFIFQLKGAASLPTRKEFFEMLGGTKKVNLPGKFMIDAYVNLSARIPHLLDPILETLQVARQLEKEVIQELQGNRQFLAGLKLAKFLTDDFFVGLSRDDKGHYFYTEGDRTMVVKTEYRQEYA